MTPNENPDRGNKTETEGGPKQQEPIDVATMAIGMGVIGVIAVLLGGPLPRLALGVLGLLSLAVILGGLPKARLVGIVLWAAFSGIIIVRMQAKERRAEEAELAAAIADARQEADRKAAAVTADTEAALRLLEDARDSGRDLTSRATAAVEALARLEAARANGSTEHEALAKKLATIKAARERLGASTNAAGGEALAPPEKPQYVEPSYEGAIKVTGPFRGTLAGEPLVEWKGKKIMARGWSTEGAWLGQTFTGYLTPTDMTETAYYGSQGQLQVEIPIWEAASNSDFAVDQATHRETVAEAKRAHAEAMAAYKVALSEYTKAAAARAKQSAEAEAELAGARTALEAALDALGAGSPDGTAALPR